MATNVSEKDRTLRLLDEYINDLDLVEYRHVLRWVREGRDAHINIRSGTSMDDLIIQRELKFDSDTGEFRRESLTVHGPEAGFTINDPTPEESARLYLYAGYRHALARVHRWVLENLGYSGDMPTEVPNQSEGADA